MRITASLLLLFLSIALTTNAQDPLRFKEEVDKLKMIPVPSPRFDEVVVFTGSSSVRMWSDLKKIYPQYSVVNTGFGGSHTSDLIFYYNDLIKRFKPDLLVIYAGDNDIYSGKSPRVVYRDIRQLVDLSQRDFPRIKIVIIAAKPSLARWSLKEDYLRLNALIKRYATKSDQIDFADVWSVMLDDRGLPRRDIFKEDDLHLNDLGYKLWRQVLDPLIAPFNLQ